MQLGVVIRTHFTCRWLKAEIELRNEILSRAIGCRSSCTPMSIVRSKIHVLYDRSSRNGDRVNTQIVTSTAKTRCYNLAAGGSKLRELQQKTS